MDDAESLVIEGENYRVVDECIEDEYIQIQQKAESTKTLESSMQDNSAGQNACSALLSPVKSSQHVSQADTNRTIDSSDNVTTNTQSEQAIASHNASTNKDSEVKQCVDNLENKETEQKYSCPKPSSATPIGFTADIALQQLMDEQEITDEDVMDHLDEIEKIDLDPSTFSIKDKQSYPDPAGQTTKENSDARNEGADLKENTNVKKVLSNAIVRKKIKDENDWYNQKLAEKLNAVKERLSKLARVLEFSYPVYKKWLELTEKIDGTPICKLEPARCCPLDKPYINRWKFVCSRKNVQEAMKESGSADATINKNVETVWPLEPSGPWGINVNNDSEFPPFVLHAVKIFEDFLQTTEQHESHVKSENFSDDEPIDVEQKKEVTVEGKQLWLWLLVRCNSMDELMLFVTGKNISRQTMDRLKQVYETGPGKDCNVKSLYCKSVNKCDDITVTDTTLLVGSEALDEVVGGIKMQLAPKTNFWSNAAGAGNIAKAVVDLLQPTSGTTVLEIGCGIGLIGLIMASKCKRVIGVDSQSEIEEAEMTCELNNIKNASFIIGSPSDVTGKIVNAIKNCETYAVINANTNIGRALDVMTCLRKISTLRRLVMVTTLTKQSVRAILELARPINRNIGHPFIPVRACVVDTLPVGPNFEVVILMKRLVVNKLTQAFTQKLMDETPYTEGEESIQTKTNERLLNNSVRKSPNNKAVTQHAQRKKLLNKVPKKKGRFSASVKKHLVDKATYNPTVSGFNSFKGKRVHSPERAGGPPRKMVKSVDKMKPWRSGKYLKHVRTTDAAPLKTKKEWPEGNPELRGNPFYGKKNTVVRNDPADLKERLSNNHIHPEMIQKVKEHQVLLEIAKEKLSEPAPTIDMRTAKQLQNMLNMVLEQTNILQNQLPCSVWDRIAPQESMRAPPESMRAPPAQNLQGDHVFKGRYVQEMGHHNMIITTSNKKFVDGVEEHPELANCPTVDNLPPERYHRPDFCKPGNQGNNNWGKEKLFEKDWSDISSMRKPAPPLRRPASPMRTQASPPRGFSLKRPPALSPPRHVSSPPRRHLSPVNGPASQLRPHAAPFVSHQTSPQWRPTSRPRPPIFQSGRQTMLQKQGEQSFVANRPMLPPRRQHSPLRRQLSPQRFTDDWNIPSRGTGEQVPWARSIQRLPEKTWREERQPSSSASWEQQHSATNETYRKPFVNQNKWETRDSSREPIWSSGEDTWNERQPSRQQFGKGNVNDTWQSSENGRWSTAATNTAPNNVNWNVRGEDSFEMRPQPWSDKFRREKNQTNDMWSKGEEDWDDLPEDAKDPWANDGNLGLKERLPKFDGPSSSSFWARETDKGDAWKNKGQSIGSKPRWETGGNQNTGKKRWTMQNDTINKLQRTRSWQSRNNSGSWQRQGFNFSTRYRAGTYPGDEKFIYM